MNTLTVTMRRRLGAFVGFALIFILILLIDVARPLAFCARQIGPWLAALLGAAVVMLATGRRAYEPLQQNRSSLEYWGETVWACVCTLVAGIGVFALMVFLSTTGLIPLNDKTGSPFTPRANGLAVPVPSKDFAVGDNSPTGIVKPSASGAKPADSAANAGKPPETLQHDLEETLKKEMNDKFAFWGTLFAWLVAILALVVTIVIWSLQKGAQDLKERFDTLEGFREFRISLEKHTLVVRLQDHLIDLQNRLESARDNNPVFQRIRPVQRLLLAARQVESNDFSTEDFGCLIDRVEAALAQPSALTRAGLLALATELRSLAEYLHAVGPRPWLPDDWSAQIKRLFRLANRLQALS